jgi:light-regulated signal transduction histidine kinase (bacteriophytochrome)
MSSRMFWRSLVMSPLPAASRSAPKCPGSLPLVWEIACNSSRFCSIWSYQWNGCDEHSGGIEACPDICGHRETKDGRLETLVSVQDAGTGFKPEEMNRLFEAFYTTKPQGMGMGLAISRSIIEAHGGRLWAEANQGPGATFLFSLPAAPEPLGAGGPHHERGRAHRIYS